VAAAFKNRGMLHSGFYVNMGPEALSAGPVTVEAWAVDMQQGAISPVANSFVIQAMHH
jgi:hypothetical protein